MSSPQSRVGAAARSLLRLSLAAMLGAAVVALVLYATSVFGPDGQVPAPGASAQLQAAAPLNDVLQDQGNTVALPDGRTLWIFADTIQAGSGPPFFLTSSAAVSTGNSVRLTYLTGLTGVPLEFLPRTEAEKAAVVPGSRYVAVWPMGATTLPNGQVLISYAKYDVQSTPQPQYTLLGAGLYTWDPGTRTRTRPARTATRLADDIWTAQDGSVASPVYHDGYVYFTVCTPRYACYVTRSAPQTLADRTAYQWWSAGGWQQQRAAATPVYIDSDVPGPSPAIRYLPRSGVFAMLSTSGGIQSRQGRIWVARNPWGPWSKAAAFELPGCPDTGCYLLNAHPEISPPGMLRVSFATFGVGPYVRVMDLPVDIDNDGPVPSVRTHAGLVGQS